MRLYLIGAGGHAKVVLSTILAAGLSVDGLFDDDPQKQGMEILGVPIVGTISDAKRSSPACGILAIGDNRTRYRLAHELLGWKWLTIIHPKAYVHPSAKLGPGTVVFAGAVIQPDTQVGAHVIINTGATVDHDCWIGDFVHLAPGVHLAGNVAVEEGAFIGIGVVAAPKVKVGAWAIVGAGAVVVEDIPPRVIAIGVPAKPAKTVQDKE
jgi:sugar O-acyltransferase (sialic acid O-acetyltransferase NeuD family)